MGKRGPHNPKSDSPILADQVREMLAEGESKRAIARTLGISGTTVNKIQRRLAAAGSAALVTRGRLSKQPTAMQAERMISRQLDVTDQLARANDKAWDLIVRLEAALIGDERADVERYNALARLLAEVRGQAEATGRLVQMMYDIREVAEWQRMVVDEIEKEAPEVASRIRKRIADRAAERRLSPGS